ncbi:MAG TPA: sulfite exporter TauE/SafE family protein [Gemmatimonadaceae bacterium]|nr:sulfite exporter TauE/SafE family protein [Gemmatimonadaceae bacterium]
MDAKTGLLIALCGFTLYYLVVLARRVAQPDQTGTGKAPTGGMLLIGFITNFFDTLGIGSFATTTAMWRKWNIVPDEQIPGTLNIGHTIPTIAQAFIFTTLVPVEARTLLLMILAAVIGSWIGANIVAKWPRRNIQIGMGSALVVAAFLMAMAFAANVGPDWAKDQDTNGVMHALISIVRGVSAVLHPIAQNMPKGGTLLALIGTALIIGCIGNFVLGALMTLGIGLYGPCMILIYFLGMDPKAAFPIMMGSCAFLMPIASARFIRAEAFNLKAALGLAVGGLPAVLIAAFLVKSMPLDVMRLLVVIVVLYAAYGLLSSAAREQRVAKGQ